MEKNINFIIASINAFADYETRDMAGSMRVKNLFNPLLEKKEVTISNLILLDLYDLERDNHNGHTQSTVPGVDCLSIGYTSFKSPLSVIKFLRNGMRFIKTHRKKDATNFIYNYQHPDIRNFLFLLYAKMKGFKVVFDIVEDKKHDAVKTFNDKLRKNFSLFFLKIMPFYTDAVFVISSHLLTETTKITGTKIPVHLLPISVDFRNIDAYKQVKIPGIPKIFYGGSFAQKDGLEYLLRAIDILKERNYQFTLILSGKAKAEDMEKILAKIQRNPMIDYRGFLTAEEYFKLLASVDICCMTRNNSAFANAGFPFKLGEFLASGKLILASRIGDVEKYLVHKESAYLITPESTSDIVDGLTYYLDNLDTLPGTMGARARQVAEENFDARVSSKFLLDKCVSLLN